MKLILTESLSDIWQLRKRAARDAERHKQKIQKAIKENLKNIIVNEDIITTDSAGKKIKIPIKQLEQWYFKHGSNKKNHGAGHSGKNIKTGDIIHIEEEPGEKKAGNNKGEMVYEDFALEEIIQIMLEDLNLPWLQEKSQKSEIENESIGYEDISKKGVISNLDLRKTLKENIKRNAMITGKGIVNNINQEDLRFKTYEYKKEYISNASIVLIMDRSGSMTTDKKYIAKSFFFWMVQFIKHKYKNVELTFIAHDTEAYICDEKQFFEMAESGGTKCSSGLQAALSCIKEKYPIDIWNNYVFAMSDGDNFEEDNKICIELVNKLLPHVNAIGYGEIILDNMSIFMSNMAEREISTLQSEFTENIKSTKFISTSISKKDDVYECLRKFFDIKDIK